MYKILLKHYWLKSVRSPGFYKNMVVNIFMGFTVIYFVGILLLLGFLLPKILTDINAGQASSETFNGVLFYALLGLLFVRYLIQPLTTLDIEHYQLLPIKRSTLTNYLIIRPLLNPLNYIALCLVVPFAFGGIYPSFGMGGTLRFLAICLMMIWFNTLAALFLKRRINNMIVGVSIFLTVGVLLVALEHFHLFSVFEASQLLFNSMIGRPFLWIGAIIPSTLAFFLNQQFFDKNYYPESFNRKIIKKSTVNTKQFSFMERFGKIGEIITLEMKLVLRHKRTKKTLYMGLLLLFYGLIFYPNETYTNSPGLLLFVAIFVTGIGMILFGQWIINWDGSHFDFLMTRDIDSQTYIKANYYLLLALSVASFIATTPYFFFGKEIILYHLVAIIYNIGVNIYVYLFAATFNTNRLELSVGSSMNMQGVSIKNFIVMIPLLAFPVTLVFIFNLFSLTYIALGIIAAIGLVGIIFRDSILRMIEQQFLKRKYTLCTGFRKKG